MKHASSYAFACAVLAACADGYPSGDADLRSPLDMTQHERIGAMNELGAKRRDGLRWHYALDRHCVLQVAAAPRPSPLGRWQLAEGMDAVMGHDGEAGHYTVLLTGGAEQARVFATPSWADAVGMRLLVKTMQVACAEAGGPAPG